LAKKRVPIPQETVDELLVSCKHGCCICEHFGVEIHHIDGNPANNEAENLIPLCGNCAKWVHVPFPAEARIQGYTQEQLRLYKKNWIEKCSNTSKIVNDIQDLKETISVLKGTVEKLQEERK
jgi:hypothetical protein